MTATGTDQRKFVLQSLEITAKQLREHWGIPNTSVSPSLASTSPTQPITKAITTQIATQNSPSRRKEGQITRKRKHVNYDDIQRSGASNDEASNDEASNDEATNDEATNDEASNDEASNDEGEITVGTQGGGQDNSKTSRTKGAQKSRITDNPRAKKKVKVASNTTHPTRVHNRSKSTPDYTGIERGLSKDCSREDLRASVMTVKTELDELQIDVLNKRRLEVMSLSDEEKEQVLDLIINDILGSRQWDNLENLVKKYNNPPEKADSGLGRRSERLATDKRLPSMIRAFYGTYSQELRKKRSGTNQIGDLISGLNFMDNYDGLMTKAAAKDPTLVDFLKENGFEAKRGQDWRTKTIDFLAYKLKCDRTKLIEDTTRLHGVKVFVDVFGEGILLLIPANQLRR